MIQQNKKTIARELDKPIHTFIYLFGNDNKFKSNTQDIFELLNEWTMGNIWDNFIIVYNRATFTQGNVKDRFDSMDELQWLTENFGPEELFWKTKNKQLSFIKKTLTERAEKKKWTRMITIDGIEQSRLMRKEDFDNIEISALNFEQARKCSLIDGYIDSKASDCWKLPIIDDNFDYKVSDDFNNIPRPQFYDKQYVFTNEMKKLYDLIIQNARHPVVTQKEYFKSELEKDLEEYNLRTSAVNTDIRETMNKTEIDVKHCDEEFQKVNSTLREVKSCPYWSPWAAWSECAICGYSKQFRNRNCMKDKQEIEMLTCQENLVDKETHQEQHCPFKPCDFTEWKDLSECSASCGLGRKQQSRKCMGAARDCIGETKRSTFCEIRPCPIWTEWSEWGRCSKTCGNGVKTRTRNCTKNTCSKTEADTNSCNLTGCKFIVNEKNITVHRSWTMGILVVMQGCWKGASETKTNKKMF